MAHSNPKNSLQFTLELRRNLVKTKYMSHFYIFRFILFKFTVYGYTHSGFLDVEYYYKCG